MVKERKKQSGSKVYRERVNEAGPEHPDHNDDGLATKVSKGRLGRVEARTVPATVIPIRPPFPSPPPPPPRTDAGAVSSDIARIRAARRSTRQSTLEESEELADLFSTRWMNVDTLHELERTSGRHFKRGRFSAREKETIRQALDEFCASRGLSRDDFINAFFMRKERGGQRYVDGRFRELFPEVTKRLPGRPVLLVYQCMRRMYHPGNKKGAWSADDDSELHRLFLQHGPDWETIGLAMGRYGMSVRDRYRLLRGKGATGPWSEEEVNRLRAAVAEVRQLTGAPSWLLVSERVGTRSAPQCILKWSLLETAIRNGGERPVWTRSLDFYLVSRLYDLAVEDESEVRWRELVGEGWPVYFGPRDLQLRWRILKKRVARSSPPSILSLDDLLEALLLSLRPLSAETISSDDEDP